MKKFTAGFLTLLMPLTIYGQVSDQNIPDPYIIEAHRLSPQDRIILDGKLDDPVWQRIIPIKNFTQQDPSEGASPTEQTEIYIAYNEEYLYIGARFYESEPDGILAYQRRRNQGLGTDDRFMWILDTFNDGRNAYFFEINPAGLLGDGLLTVGQGTNLNKSWDGIWDARTYITDWGWSAEIRIPFRTLDFDADNSVWGINFQRTVRRKNEEILWSGWRRNQGIFRPQNAGKLTGLEDMNQGIGLEVTPYLTATPTRSWPGDGSVSDSFNADAGFDISYSITPSLRTSLTVNTDFAEAEVDARRVNLTRFPLVFPEQRDFFLEGSSVFTFAPASGITPFFSRRIGLAAGEPVPIHAGARAIGRVDDTNIGFYQIRTGSNGDRGEDFTVGRVVQNFFSESRAGIIYTRRATLGDDFFPVRQTLGADLELSTSRFLGDKNLQFQAFMVWHNESTVEDESEFWDRTSRGVRVAYPNYPFTFWASYREFGNAFNPAVGIAPRVAFRRFQPTFQYDRVLSNSRLIRSVTFQLFHEYLMDLDFEPETVNTRLRPLDIRFESGDRIWASINRNFERLHVPFDILRDGTILIPEGSYTNFSFNANLSTASFRRLSADLGYTYEGFWTGTRSVYNTTLTVRPFPGINLSADWSRSDVNLEEGDFTTDLIRFRGNIDLTPRISFTNIVQFDNVSELLGLYNRFRWIVTPGSDIYLVHTWNWIQIDNRFSPLETQGSVKVNYTYRF